jgi:type IV secretory pathway VirB4 component
MFKVKQIAKDYREAAALCSQVNLFGFVDDEIFLTKSGDVGIVLAIEGVDYECLDTNTIDNLTRRLTAAFRVFDEKCHVYQYLFKRNRENIPFKTYQNPIVNAAIRNRMEFLKSKSEYLYSFQICYVVLFAGFRHNASILASLAKIGTNPRQAIRELKGLVFTRKQVVLIDGEVQKSMSALRVKARSFVGQIGDFVGTRILAKDEAFRVL